MEKIGSGCATSALRNHLFLKNGVYRLVFDNTYSLVRAKEIIFCVLHLETISTHFDSTHFDSTRFDSTHFDSTHFEEVNS